MVLHIRGLILSGRGQGSSGAMELSSIGYAANVNLQVEASPEIPKAPGRLGGRTSH
ncbi:hypothetical protein FA13DRAFT_1744270 [Coprinellus micaceus]|nr:hypothetical protein FA13DRAFT_1744270 [Coprinellus micaceus]